MKKKNKKLNPVINNIFPTPIYIDNLNRNLTTEEILLVNKTKLDTFLNEGNKISNDKNILENIIFKNLKEDIYLRVIDYFDKIISPDNNVTPYITQSWINYTEKNEFHHKHHHPNSLVSGVFYINCDERFDKIKFFNELYTQIQPKVKTYNLYNSFSWWFPVKDGDLIMFPSSLSHMVETKKETNTRISLAFNVFVKGTLGDEKYLTHLILK
jgi:uncharacterized protein (TIGR02466 family)